ncbi:MAG: hypothetical protein C0608_02410 [Deltaproteobacteria bacterium]|nr:MAG: hypothetical protein C0608_02410 [Deltaproteobacteria bacterium]
MGDDGKRVNEGDKDKVRSHVRVELAMPVGIVSGALGQAAGKVYTTTDISPSGFYIKTDLKVDNGTRLFAKYVLPSGRRGMRSGSVVRCDGKGIAVCFDSVDPLIMEEFGYSDKNR